MRRREFITVLGSAAVAWPLAARAQQAGRLPRVVFLSGVSADDPDIRASIAAFRTAFEKLSWTDGRNVSIDFSRVGAIPAERQPEVAAEVVRSAPAVIVSSGTPLSNAVRLATK